MKFEPVRGSLLNRYTTPYHCFDISRWCTVDWSYSHHLKFSIWHTVCGSQRFHDHSFEFHDRNSYKIIRHWDHQNGSFGTSMFYFDLWRNSDDSDKHESNDQWFRQSLISFHVIMISYLDALWDHLDKIYRSSYLWNTLESLQYH